MERIKNFLSLIRSYTMRVPMWIRLVILALVFGIPGYWMVTESGLYGVFAAWEASLDGTDDYHITLAYLLSVLVLLMPSAALMVILGNFFPEKSEEETKLK